MKADISLGATKKEREDKVKRFTKAQKLLLNFNLSAYAFDPGVRCLSLWHERSANKGDGPEVIDFDAVTWKYIEPLLKELLRYRRKYAFSAKKS